MTRAELIGGNLCVGFSFADLAVGGAAGAESSPAVEDERSCGVAVADDGAVFGDCVVSLHPTADGARVLGLIRVGPDVGPDAGRIRIVVVPLAGLDGVPHSFFQLSLVVAGGRPQLESVRWL